MVETLTNLLSQHGYPIIFVLLFLGIFGLPIPDEFLLAFAGALISEGKLHFLPTIVSATLGSMCGITLSYIVGRTAGIHLVRKYGCRFGISNEKIDHVHLWFERAGRWVLTFGYFIPGLRHIMALIAGTSKLELPVSPDLPTPGASSGALLLFSWATSLESNGLICPGQFITPRCSSFVFFFWD